MLQKQIRGIETAVSAYASVEQKMVQLLAPVQGMDGRDIPQAGIDALRREAQAALERGVRAPIPRPFSGEAVDPTIRSAA